MVNVYFHSRLTRQSVAFIATVIVLKSSVLGATFDWAKLVTPAEGNYTVKAVTVNSKGDAILAATRWVYTAQQTVDANSYLSNVVTRVDTRGNVLWSAPDESQFGWTDEAWKSETIRTITLQQGQAQP